MSVAEDNAGSMWWGEVGREDWILLRFELNVKMAQNNTNLSNCTIANDDELSANLESRD